MSYLLWDWGLLGIDEMDKGTLLWFLGVLLFVGPAIFRCFDPAATPFLVVLGVLSLVLGLALMCTGFWLMNRQRKKRNLSRRKFGWTSIKKKA